MYLTSKKVKIIFVAVAGALIAFIAFGDIFQNVTLVLVEGFSNFSPTTHQKENKYLSEAKLACKLELTQYQDLLKENKLLRQMLDFKERSGLDLIVSKVIAFSPSSWQRYAFIDVGKDREVEPGMIVLDKNGNLVGKIDQIYKNRSKVILMNNPDFQIPARIGKDIFGLLQGNISGLEVLYVEKDDLVDTGDLVYTATSIFDTSVEVGRVSLIRKREANLFYEIQVEPFSKDKHSRVVFVLK